MRPTILLPALVLLPPAALGQTATPPQEPAPDAPQVQLPYIPIYGGSVGFGNLLSGRSRDTFGGSGISLAPGLGSVYTKYGLSLAPGFNFFSARKDVGGERNKIFLLSLGPSFRYGFVKPITVSKVDGNPVFHFRTFEPFAEVGVGLIYGDLSVHSAGISNKTLTVGGNLALGTTVGKNAFVRATLRVQPLIDSYDFNRYGVELGIRF